MLERMMDKCCKCQFKIEDFETDDVVIECIYRLLTVRQYYIFLRYYLEKATYTDISRDFGVTQGRCRQILSKAKKVFFGVCDISEEELREILEKNYYKLQGLSTKQVFYVDLEKVKKLKRFYNPSLAHMRVSFNGEHDKSLENKQQINPVIKKSDVPIEDMEICVRAYNCLKASDIHTLGDLSKLSEWELLQIKNLGRKSAREIRESYFALTGEHLRKEQLNEVD